MRPEPHQPPDDPARQALRREVWHVALAGLASLAVAMGIGRFAFTPLLPMMLAQGPLSLSAAGALASANYLGYLIGALACMLQPWLARRLRLAAAVDAPRTVRRGLVLTAALTLAMALPWPAAWPLLRFAAGVASAFVLVHTSGWCLARLASLGAPMRGGVIYAGPGAGIVVSGLAVGAMASAGWTAGTAWAVCAGLAALLTAGVWRVFHEPPAGPSTAPAAVTASSALPASTAAMNRAASPAPTAGAPGAAGPAPAAPAPIEFWLLCAIYGLAGFGYIITATFLPVIARAALPGSPWIDLFWPIFGAAVVVGALGASRLEPEGDRRMRLAVAYGLQAAGICLGLVWPTLPGFVFGSLLLGLPFTAITFFAVQEIRQLRPDAVASGIGFATVLYGIGQIVGPLLVSVLVARAPDAHQGFSWALGAAAGTLLLGMLGLLVMARRGR
jgi:Uncharacterised MFS-type transporter YbfB